MTMASQAVAEDLATVPNPEKDTKITQALDGGLDRDHEVGTLEIDFEAERRVLRKVDINIITLFGVRQRE